MVEKKINVKKEKREKGYIKQKNIKKKGNQKEENHVSKVKDKML